MMQWLIGWVTLGMGNAKSTWILDKFENILAVLGISKAKIYRMMVSLYQLSFLLTTSY